MNEIIVLQRFMNDFRDRKLQISCPSPPDGISVGARENHRENAPLFIKYERLTG